MRVVGREGKWGRVFGREGGREGNWGRVGVFLHQSF